MRPFAGADLRTNRGTWAVPATLAPAVARVLLDSLPPEAYDPAFRGQALATTYFDTAGFDLRKARQAGDRYLTLRVRCYPAPEGELYAVSAKTEAQKWRAEIPAEVAAALLGGPGPPGEWAGLLPPDLYARLLGLVGDGPLGPVVTVSCRRYAVEDRRDRLTLDLGVITDTGKCLPHGVLEFKSAAASAAPPPELERLRLRPTKLSKFKWATGV
jgi:hypothetical protein